ncbi:hypothetical protein [Devosia sp.]|uniref:hypothetical protein n=1 Tax=Devosia sp. TaxID=1871048 RepID=UPI001AC3082E|nr:hypothetical protein [Devosia sp.]MBN9336138.1 hypothetical protein [Devosia sp.]
MTDATWSVPPSVRDAVQSLWRRGGQRPDNMFRSPEFVRLKEACIGAYDVGSAFWFTMSLWEILKSLGCPLLIPVDRQELALPEDEAALQLHLALTAQTATVIHLCPLDWAERPPVVSFGDNWVGRLSAEELRSIIDAERLARAFPQVRPNWEDLAQFYWLVVRETVPLDTEPGQRTTPLVYAMNRDLGAITAHEDRFPPAVERALFHVLLAPWEDWSEAIEVDWRGFRIPWVYSVSTDLCVRANPPPLESSLTWTTETFDHYGDVVDVEVPAHYRLADDAEGLPALVNDTAWSQTVLAMESVLFDAPIRHFLVRAFYSSGIDEFMAHLTVFEAALGLHSDFQKPKGDPRAGRSVTRIMSTRVERLLEQVGAGQEYTDLFDLRSAYVHGRQMGPISSDVRVRARRLARRVVVSLIDRALGRVGSPPADRETFLIALCEPW